MFVKPTATILVFAAIFLDGTMALIKQECPPTEEIEPCTCKSDRFSHEKEIVCSSMPMDRMQTALAALRLENESLDLKLEDIQLSTLPSSLLADLNFYKLRLFKCNVSSVDNDVFSHVVDKLVSLEICHNALEKVPSNALKNLSSLRSLLLNYNRLEVLDAEAFMGLHSLKNLELRNNKINFIHESAFFGIGIKFERLSLSFNELTSVPSRALRHIGSSIKGLLLHNNKIAALLPEEFVTMGGSFLNYLILENNKIRELPPGAFRSLKNLNWLQLISNEIEYVHPLAFQGLEDVSRLELGYNRLTEIPAEALKNMSRIRIIGFGGNKISTIRKDDFKSSAKSLEDVYLSGSELKSVDSMAFFGLDSLRFLWLNDNELKNVPYETYANVLDTLEDFNLHGNPLHCDCQVAWLSDWMRGNGSAVVTTAYGDVKCVTPEQFANVPVKNVYRHQLDCPDSSYNENENCVHN